MFIYFEILFLQTFRNKILLILSFINIVCMKIHQILYEEIFFILNLKMIKINAY